MTHRASILEDGRSSLALLFAAAFACAACGDDGGGTDGGSDADSDADSGAHGDLDAGEDAGGDLDYPIDSITVAEWESCSLIEGEDDGRAGCATVQMPLFWDAPDGRTIGIRVKRLLPSVTPTAQIWLLDGGPGAAGTYHLPALMEKLQTLFPALEVYTLDHRGTGLSERLSCPTYEAASSASAESISSAEMPSCIEEMRAEEGDRLDAITSSFSSIDVAALITATRRPGVKVFLYGTSYGSYFAHRIVQIFPELVDGVAISGIAPPDASFIYFDEYTNLAAEKLFDLCAEDDFCASKLGDDPWAALGDALASMDEGHCTSNGLSKDLVRILFAYLMYDNAMMPAIPAATYRLARCEAADADALLALYEFLFGDSGVWDIAEYSILLQHHVSLSEMWASPEYEGVDLAQYFEVLDATAYVMKGLGPTRLDLLEQWPLYEDAEYDDGWSTTTVPMLMLQGDLDPATPIEKARAMVDHFNAPHQTFLEFPYAGHGVFGRAPLAEGDGATDCGYSLLVDFLTDPNADLDTSCVDQVLPIDFAGDTDLAAAVFGTSDLWENEPAAKAHRASGAKKEYRDLARAIRAELP